MVMFLGLVFIWGSHPLLMMGGLLMVVILGFLYLYYTSMSFWVGYLLMLIMLSGVLVVFSYMLSMIPNFAFENFSMLMSFLVTLTVVSSVMEKFVYSDASGYVYSMWGPHMSLMTLYLVSILLLLMVIVLYMSIYTKGSLRIN
uniref:NADH dehydrogenase subunit 6 n=1 Tax=Tetragnatha nitens TaxID=545214 RepID=A0A0N7BWA9_9ARAC|nr:NADH dehydrogenase subunit 6 [Tetragnatha nitens]AKG65090.1 NADH dehydrogenase subunit 6 [Tetragnatha nitens]